VQPKRRPVLHVVCSWCREPVSEPGEQLRLFETPGKTTHTICDRCFEQVAARALR
jgi:hypothetical protein